MQEETRHIVELIEGIEGAEEAKRSALHDVQVKLGARFTEWNGYYVPDHFGQPVEEYWAVRRRAGIIDMSALQKFDVLGSDAVRFLNRVLTRDVARAVNGQALYSPICNARGGFIDDSIAFRIDEMQFMLVTGGGEHDEEWLREQAKGLNVALVNVTGSRVDIAVQGPHSRAILQRLTQSDLGELDYYAFTSARLAGFDVLLSRTGYSGELGYELFAPCEQATDIWKAIAQTAEPGELTPYGFKALDVLRIESALVFCGYEMDAANTPYDVGLGWTVDLDKESFIGKTALAWAKQQGPRETLVGLEVEDVYFPESGARLFRDGRKAGIVTSPTFSPLMEKVIALARVKPEHTRPGTELQVDMGNRTRTAWVVRIPFYDPSKRRVII